MTEWIDLYIALIGHEPEPKQILLVTLTPLFLLTLGLEYLAQRRRGRTGMFRRGDIVTNLSLGASYQAVEMLYHVIFLGAALAFAYQFRLTTIEMSLGMWAVLLFAQEFFYYWFHRGSHRIRWFWCAHVVHHSSEHMNLSTAMRQSMTYSLNFSQIFWLPLILIGFPPTAVMVAYSINLAYQYFVHTEAVGKLSPLVEGIFNTPSHHRAHHGRNPIYIDKNYGGILIIWDRLFGTFQPELSEQPVEYGIPRQIRSHNILTLNLHEWRDMFRDVLRPGPLWLRLQHLWKPPEWQRPATTAPQQPLEATL
ncbi:MAG TPA: sterol desaturase family protein [Spongiibacteraceae bacterium]|nr:sterol desaturase [Spongiibacteraceae bacterium]HCS26363.1 sterol desaturase family protein [Spongiibacteraceae bacterium]